MVAFNFQKVFAPKIQDGTKIQTIRAKIRCHPGQLMQLYTGMRTKACAKIIADRSCALVDYCHLAPDGITFGDKTKHPSIDEFAQLDGFKSFDDLLSWFQGKYGTPHFIGYVHRWTA